MLITFISHNLLLFAALAVILAMLALNLFGGRLRGYQTTTPAQAIQMINHQNAMVLDVREDKEYRSGHILNAIHIPQARVKERMAELDKHKDKPIIVGCRSGHRSGQVCAQLKKQGFETIYNLSGGIMAWQNANLPLVKK